MNPKIDYYRIDEISDNHDVDSLSSFLYDQDIRLRSYALDKLAAYPSAQNHEVVLAIRDYLHVDSMLLRISPEEFNFFGKLINLLFIFAFQRGDLLARELILHFICLGSYKIAPEHDKFTGFDMNNFEDNLLQMVFYSGFVIKEIKLMGLDSFIKCASPLPIWIQQLAFKRTEAFRVKSLREN